jgi:hypothetical protein
MTVTVPACPVASIRSLVASAPGDGVPTVSSVPNHQPPRTTRHGHLHAVDRPAPIPVRLDGVADPSDRRHADGASLLQRFATAARPAADHGVVVARKLDRGRLCAHELVDAVGFAADTALAADVSRTGRVRLTVARPLAGVANASTPVAGTSRAHVDARRQIVITSGLRAFLGVGAGGEVIARVLDDHTVEILTAATLAVAIDALDLVASAATSTDSVVARRSIHPHTDTTMELPR